jgi:hypothetical protein
MSKLKLSFIKISETEKNLCQASTHRTGHIGFNKHASKLMGIQPGSRLQLATNEGEKSAIYMQVTQNKADSVEVKNVGEYNAIKIGSALTMLGYNYTSLRYTFDVSAVDYQGNTIYRLLVKKTGHLTGRKKKENKDAEE